jgi:hypothetical protein
MSSFLPSLLNYLITADEKLQKEEAKSFSLQRRRTHKRDLKKKRVEFAV